MISRWVATKPGETLQLSRSDMVYCLPLETQSISALTEWNQSFFFWRFRHKSSPENNRNRDQTSFLVVPAICPTDYCYNQSVGYNFVCKRETSFTWSSCSAELYTYFQSFDCTSSYSSCHTASRRPKGPTLQAHNMAGKLEKTKPSYKCNSQSVCWCLWISSGCQTSGKHHFWVRKQQALPKCRLCR